MKTSILCMLMAAATLTSPAIAATVEALQGDTAAQAPIGPEPSGRFATEFIDDAVLTHLSGGVTGLLQATGTTLTLQYLGTSAARGASLQFAGQPLFDTRSGCPYASALVDDFCVIDSIGRTRAISGLAAGDSLVFGLNAQAQALGDASHLRPTAESFDSLSSTRLVDLGGGQWLMGFEEGSDASYNDMVFLLIGASLQVPAVPEPSSLMLLGAGALLVALRRRKPWVQWHP